MPGNNHHLRGRLRLRFSTLKNDLPRLTGVIESLRGVAGVDAVEASPYTGGMLIHYDPAAGDTRRFWDDVQTALASHSLYHDPRPLQRQAGAGAPGRKAGVADALAGKLVDKMLDKLVERSAVALVAALL